MPEHYKIELPLPPNRANQSRGIARYEGFYKKRYFNKLEGYFLSIKSGLPPIPWEKAEFEAVIEVPRLMDFDNLIARLKWPVDALVYFGVLKDDHPNNLWPRSFPKQNLIRKRRLKYVHFNFWVIE